MTELKVVEMNSGVCVCVCSQSLLDEFLQLADARRLLLRGAAEQRRAAVGPGGRRGEPLPEELQHAALLAALQALKYTQSTHKNHTQITQKVFVEHETRGK